MGTEEATLGGESRGRERFPKQSNPQLLQALPSPTLYSRPPSPGTAGMSHTHLPHAHAFPPSLLWQTFQGTQLTPLGLTARSAGGMGSYLDLAQPEKAEQFEIYESRPGRREKPAPPNLQLGPTYPAQPLAI